MKKAFLALALSVGTALSFSSAQAAPILNVSASVIVDATASITLGPGTYQINPIGIADGGLYDAWHAWGLGDTVGCDGSGENCSQGWIWGVWAGSSTSLGPVGNLFIGNTGLRFGSAAQALAEAQASLTGSAFTLSSTELVTFANLDNLGDNLGGVSFTVTLVGAGVPAPGALALLGLGLIGLGVVRRK